MWWWTVVLVEDLDDASRSKSLTYPAEWDIFPAARGTGVADLGPIYRGPCQLPDWLSPPHQRHRTSYVMQSTPGAYSAADEFPI